MINFEDFVSNSGVGVALLNNLGARDVFGFLLQPENTNNCVVFSALGLPVLSGIAKPLEDLFDNNSLFPLSYEQNRKNVGKMVKYIMSFYGYSPREAKSSEKRLRNFSQASYFKTSAIYVKTHEPLLKITVTSSPVD
ncbi:MAG: hypothetical protein F8N39_13645 [Clostridiaceae bacterium]|nr:hypothetical protein [Clostridiaceae bacterium]